MATARPPAVLSRALAMPPASSSARPRASPRGNHVEGLDHPQHGPHQAQQRPDGGDGVKDAEVAAERLVTRSPQSMTACSTSTAGRPHLRTAPAKTFATGLPLSSHRARAC